MSPPSARGGRTGTVVHLAPHADDELIGAPATLLALRDAGWRVVNVVCSLGTRSQAPRRHAELVDSCGRAGFVLRLARRLLPDPLGPDDPARWAGSLEADVAEVLDVERPDLVVAPSPHDRHRGHEIVGRCALAACGSRPQIVTRVWLWGLWADLPFPTLLVTFGAERLEEILHALSAHKGELARNDYRRLVSGRASMNASLGPERVFGFGSRAEDADLAEVLTELGAAGDCWRFGLPRRLDPGAPFGPLGIRSAQPWLDSPSLTSVYGPPGEHLRRGESVRTGGDRGA